MLHIVLVSLIYALPAVPFFLFGKMMQNRYSKVLVEQSQVQTGQFAEAVANQVLKQNSLTDVTVERGEDYSVNRFDPESQKVVLSPETMGQKDVSSVGMALYAVGSCLSERKDPDFAWLRKQMSILEPVAFWTVFTILAFGVMASSLPVVILGYVLSVVTWGIRHFNVRSNERSGLLALEEANKKEIFRPEEYTRLKEVISVLARHA